MSYDSFMFYIIGEVDGAERFKYVGSSHDTAFNGYASNNQLISANWDYSKYGFDRLELVLGIGWDEAALIFNRNDGIVFYVDLPATPFADPGHRYKHFAGLITNMRQVLRNDEEAVKIVARGPAYTLKNVFTKYTETYINQSPEQIAESIWFKHVYDDPVYFYVSGGSWIPKYDIDQTIYGTSDPYPYLSVGGSSGITIDRYEITSGTRVWDIFDRLASFASYNTDKNFIWGYQPWWRPINSLTETVPFNAGYYFMDANLTQFQGVMHTFELGEDVRFLDKNFDNALVTNAVIHGGRLAAGYDLYYEQSLTDQEMREGSGRIRFTVRDNSIKTQAAAAQLATGILNQYGVDEPYFKLRATAPTIVSGGAMIPLMGKIRLRDIVTGTIKQTVSQFSSLRVNAFQKGEEPSVEILIGKKPIPNFNRHSSDTILGGGPFPQQDIIAPLVFPPDATNSVTASVTNPSFPTTSATASVDPSESIVDDKVYPPEFPNWWGSITPSASPSPTVSPSPSPTVSPSPSPTVSPTPSATASATASVTASPTPSPTTSPTQSLAPVPAQICVDLPSMFGYYDDRSTGWFSTREAGFMEWEELIGCDGLDFVAVKQCIWDEYQSHLGSYGLWFYLNVPEVVAKENYWVSPYTLFWKEEGNCPAG